MIALLLVAALATDSTPSARIAALGERVFAHQIATDGLTRLRYGMPADRLPDLTEEGNRADLAFWRSVEVALAAIPDAGLSVEDGLSKAIMQWVAAHTIELGQYYWFSSGLTPYASPFPATHQLFAALPLATDADRTRYLGLVHQYVGMVDATRSKLLGQAERHIVLPKPELELVVPYLKSFRQPARSSPLWVADQRLAPMPASEKTKFQADLSRAIEHDVNPALDRAIQYLAGDYGKTASAAVGLSQYPNGKEYYRALVRYHTTLDLDPETIFRIGQRQIDSLSKELDRVRAQVGFKGTLAEFQASLRTNPRYFVKTPDEVGRRLEAYAKEMEPKLDSLFSRRPKAPYGVARLAPELEPTMSYGYYNPPQASRPKGIYFYNGARVTERNLAMVEGLTYHELVPGHHFQFALQQENTSLPRFRREQSFTANAEGWGDYASMLGADAGLYRDPYSRAGRLMMEMMLGTRLVLDVGMNYYGWSLDSARAFMRAHTLEAEPQIKTETLRYSVDIPGQALAYRMGSLTIRRIRENAKRALGSAWDVRKFHAAFLDSGSLPLAVFERHVQRVVVEGKRAP